MKKNFKSILSIIALALIVAVATPGSAIASSTGAGSAIASSTGAGSVGTNSTNSAAPAGADVEALKTTAPDQQVGLYSTVKATKISVGEIPQMTPGMSFAPTVKVTPENAYGKITYKSSDESIVRVNKAGKLLACGTGTTKVTATAYGGASCTFTVKVTGKFGKLTYKLNKAKTEATITGCDKDALAVKIPATYKGAPVTKIAGGAFAECERLRFFVVDKEQKTFYAEDGVLFTDKPVKTLVRMPNYYCNEYEEDREYCVPEGTVAIGEYAFSGLNRYLDIYLPDSVTKLGNCAFYKIMAQSALYPTENLTDIGESLMLDQRANVAFFVPSWESHIADYCEEHFIPCGAFFDYETKTKTAKTKKVTASSAKSFKKPSAKKTVTYKENGTYFSEFLHDTIDLSAYQKENVKQVKINFEKMWKDLIPDADGNVRENYPAMTGIYGIGYTEGKATLVGYDLQGNITGISKVKDDFTFAFEGAVVLGVVDGKNTVLTATPHEITFVTSEGNLPMQPEDWIMNPSGTGFRHIALCFPYGNASVDLPDFINVVSYSMTKDPYGNMASDSSHYSMITVSFNSSVRMDESANISLHLDGLEKLYESEEFVCIAKSSLRLGEEYGRRAMDILKTVKEVMVGTYYPKNTPVAQITLSLDGSYPSTYETKIGVDDYYADIEDVSTIATLAHEMTHAIDQSIPQMEISPSTWWEGRAQYVEEKVLNKLNIYSYPVNDESYDWSFLNEEDKEDFFHYYYFNSNRQTPYVVGFFFLKYINEKYGEDVSAKIMANIASVTEKGKYASQEGNYSWQYSDLPKERKAELFKECVTKATSETVFQDFVRDVIK